MIAIVAALPREIAKLVGDARPDAGLRREGVWLYRLPGVAVVAAGMGAERVTRAVAAAGEVSMLVSVGLAGACSGEVGVGTAAEAGLVVDARTGERYQTAAGGGVVLATAEAIASVAEKARLAETYGAAMVDMEAATVARLARARGVEFRAIKGISDGAGFELEGLSEFAGQRGEFRTGAFALHTALRPWTWGKAIALGKHSGQALEAMTEQVRRLIAES